MAPIGQSGTVTWIGHGTVLLVSAEGTRVLIDPWLDGNPAACDGATVSGIGPVDVIAITHGHADHIGSLRDVALASSAEIVCTTEVASYCAWLKLSNVSDMNKGGALTFGDVEVRMVSADHASGVDLSDGSVNSCGGQAVGYVFGFTGGSHAPVYVAGDTNVFGDMAIIRDLYGPELGLLPIDGRYNMGPTEAAYATRLLGLKRVVPIHFGTSPALPGKASDFKRIVGEGGGDAECVCLEPGGSVALEAELHA